MHPSFDWTINLGNILVLVGFTVTVLVFMIKMHVRLSIVETWMQTEGARADKALNVLDTVGKALERVTVLYEAMDARVSRVDDRVLTLEKEKRRV